MPALRAAGAEAKLNVAQPVGGDVNERRNHTNRQARQQQHDPDLAGVQKVSDIANDATTRARAQHAQALSLFCVFEDPVDGRQVLVADSSPGALGVPIVCEAIFPVFRARGCCASKDCLSQRPGDTVERVGRLVSAAGRALLRSRRRCGRGARQRGKDSQRVGQQRGLLLALEGQRRTEIAMDRVVVEDVAVVIVIVIVVVEEVELVGRVRSDDGGRLGG